VTRALVVATAIAAVTAACRGAPPGAGAGAADPAGAGAAPCAGCHADVAREWSGSLHHASFRSPDFQASLAEEPLDFCVRCHAPLAAGADDARGKDEGVGCASCHERAREHALRPRAERATTGACDACHDFAFPRAGKGGERMQRTAEEHARSDFAAVPCADCHMPRARAHARSHAFAASRDPAKLRAAIAVVPPRLVPEGVEVVVRSVGVGHAMPTGDLFRALRVRLWTEDADGRVLSDDEAWLTRVFRDDRGGGSVSAVEIRDDRLSGAPRALRFALPAGARPRLAHVIVTYDRVASVRHGVRTSFGETVLVDTAQELSP